MTKFEFHDDEILKNEKDINNLSTLIESISFEQLTSIRKRLDLPRTFIYIKGKHKEENDDQSRMAELID